MPYPRWIVDVKQDGPLQRRVARRYCEQCGDPVIYGLDADIAAREVRAQIWPVSRAGEFVALLNGARTYMLMPYRYGGYELEPRRAVHIREWHRYTVIADHHCDKAWPVADEETRRSTPTSDAPPF